MARILSKGGNRVIYDAYTALQITRFAERDV